MTGRTVLLLATAIANSGCMIQTTEKQLSATEEWNVLNELIGEPVKGKVVSIGAAVLNYIPPQPTALAGFGSISRRLVPPVFNSDSSISFCREYKTVQNPPRVKAAVLNIDNQTPDNKEKVFFISLDLVAVPMDLSKKVMRTIDDIFGSGTASIHNTFITATHTHSGPAGLTESPLWSSFICDSYDESLTENYLSVVKSALEQASSSTRPVSRVKSQIYNASNYLHSRIKSMQPDSQVSVLRFADDNNESPLAFLQMAVHPTTLGTKSLTLSADLVTPLEQYFASELSIEKVFLMQTQVGNMESLKSGASNDAWALALANDFKVKSESIESENLNFSTAAKIISLPSKSINWNGCDAAAAKFAVSLPILDLLPSLVPVAKIRIGEQTQLFLPGEWTVNAAQQVIELFSKESQNTSNTRVFSLAYDYTGYHIDREHYDQSSIESCSSLYGKNGLEQIKTAIQSLNTNEN